MNKQKVFVTAESRHITRNILVTIAEAISSPAALEKLACRPPAIGMYQFAGALLECINDSEPGVRVVAAVLLLKLFTMKSPELGEPTAADVASNVLLTEFEKGDASLQFMICTLLAAYDMPLKEIPGSKRLLRTLLRLVEDSEVSLKLSAAIVITYYPRHASSVVGIFSSYLQHPNPAVVILAARGFAGLQVRSDAIDKLISALPTVPDEAKVFIFRALGRAGQLARKAAPILAAFIEDVDAHSAGRNYAARALANVEGPSPLAMRALLKALESRKLQVVAGAVDALRTLGPLPGAAIKSLGELLSANDDDLAVAAAMALTHAGERAAKYAHKLVDCALASEHVSTIEPMAKALAAIGDGAMPHLLPLLQSTNTHSLAVAGAVFFTMGKAAAPGLVFYLEQQKDSRIRLQVATILQALGPEVSDSVPALAEMLASTDDDELAMCILYVLSNCDHVAAPALPALIRCILERAEPLPSLAEQVIHKCGPSALPAVTRALESLEGQQRERLETILASLRLGDGHQFVELERLQCDELLESFALVARMLNDIGPVSKRQMPAELKKWLASDTQQSDFEGSESGLRTDLDVLAKRLGYGLFEWDKNGRGQRLTNQAEVLYPRVVEYLRLRNSRLRG